MPRFELVVPAYNEAKNLTDILTRAVNAAKEFQRTPNDFQLVVVNNGSTDESKALLENLKRGPLGLYFRVVEVQKNQGYGHGVFEGLKTCTAEWVGWTHGDLQCDPKDAFKALEVLKASESKKVLVKGKRSGRNWKDVGVSRVFEGFARVFLGLKVNEINAQPKVFRKELLKVLTWPPGNFSFDLYVLYQAAKAGYEFKTIPVVFPPRVHGVSNWASGFLSRYKTIFGVLKYMKQLSQSEGRL